MSLLTVNSLTVIMTAPSQSSPCPADFLSSYRAQFPSYPGVAAPPRMGALLRDKLRKETTLSHAPPEHFATTAATNFLPFVVPPAERSHNLKPKPHRVYTSPFCATTTTASVFVDGPQTAYQRRIPPRSFSPLFPHDPTSQPATYFTTTNAAFAAASQSLLQTMTPSDIHPLRLVRHEELSLPTAALSSESSYKSDYPPRQVEASPPRHAARASAERVPDTRAWVTTAMEFFRKPASDRAPSVTLLSLPGHSCGSAVP